MFRFIAKLVGKRSFNKISNINIISLTYILHKYIYILIMNKINILPLIQSFVVFSESENMTVAADKLGLTQPGLSQHLQQLQNNFKQNIFSTSGRKKVLTPFGFELYSMMKNKLQNFETDLNILRTLHETPQNVSIKIAARAEILTRMCSKINFEGRIEYIASDSKSIYKLITDHSVDIGITHSLDHTQLDIYSKKIFKEGYSALVPKKWNLSKDRLDKKTFDYLIQQPYFTYSGVSLYKTLFEKFDCKEKNEPKIKIENWKEIADLVESGKGWAIIPNYFANQKNTFSISIEESHIPGLQFYLIYEKYYNKTSWFPLLIEDIKKALG